MKAGKEVELETLKKEQEALKAKILKLREERENLQHEIDQVAERVRHAECRNQQIFLFLTKATKIPNFVQQLTHKRRQKRKVETCESGKKSKLLNPDGEATECLLEVMDHKIQSPNLDCQRISDEARMEFAPNNAGPEDFETVRMHNIWPPPMGGGDFRAVRSQTPNEMAGPSTSDMPWVFHQMSEQLLGDNVVVGDDAEDDVEVGLAMVTQESIYLDLEDLIEKCCAWSDFTSD